MGTPFLKTLEETVEVLSKNMSIVFANIEKIYSIITTLKKQGVQDLEPVQDKLKKLQKEMGNFSFIQEDMLESQKITRMELVTVMSDLSEVKKKLNDLQREVVSENKSLPQVKNDSRRWEFSFEKLRAKVRELESALARAGLLRERPPRPHNNDIDSFVAGFKECIKQQMIDGKKGHTRLMSQSMEVMERSSDLPENTEQEEEASSATTFPTSDEDQRFNRFCQSLLQFIEDFESRES